jgi:DNA-binding NarL/FixJ family response regulator
VRVTLRGDESARLAVVSFPISRAGLPELTSAEQAVVLLMLSGHDHAAIARIRRVSRRTIANQVASVFRKLGVHSRLELATRLDAPGGGSAK